MDQRLNRLIAWASAEIRSHSSLEREPEVEMVSGDASFRRYFRLRFRERSWILVDAPPDKEDNPRFIRIAQRWKAQQVAVPDILASDLENGFMLVEDFGDHVLWAALHAPGVLPEDIEGHYRKAIDQLIHLQSVPTESLPEYNETLLRQEMSLFPDWLCEQQLGMTLSGSERMLFEQAMDTLVHQALSQPRVVVHRDYHSRNLMLQPDGSLGIIDFQDAVAGPATYDLVSLLRDCYVRWDSEQVDELLVYYWKQARARGVYLNDWPVLVRDFDLMGMQRHLKAAGIFARLNLRDGKSGYLADIPNTCQYLLDISTRYPELADFHGWLASSVMPALDVSAS